MNEMQVFQNSEFGELGVLELEGKPYFPATACAKILGYAKPHNAISPALQVLPETGSTPIRKTPVRWLK